MRQCVTCEKSYKMGGTRVLLRGHYNPTSWKKKKANLQWARLPDRPGRVLMCTRCLKTRAKTK